jgi:hypothetical protein
LDDAKKLDLIQTDTLINTEDFFNISTIGDNGNLFLNVQVQNINAPDPNPSRIVLYRIVNGDLIQISERTFDIPVTYGGIANNGQFVYIAVETGSATEIRILNVPSLETNRTIDIPNANDSAKSLLVSEQLLNNRYLGVSYLPTGSETEYEVALIDLEIGTVTATGSIPVTSQAPPSVFCLNGKIYVSVTSIQLVEGVPIGESRFVLYQKKGSLFVPIQSIILPSTGVGLAVTIRKGIALIAVSTLRANVPGVVPLINPTENANPLGNPGGLYIFGFDGCNFCLVAQEALGGGTISLREIAFDPTGNFLVVTTISGGSRLDSSTLIIYRVKSGKNCSLDLVRGIDKCCDQLKLECTAVSYAPPQALNIDFSQDARYLTISGGTFNLGDPLQNTLPKSVLYRLNYDPCSKKHHKKHHKKHLKYDDSSQL